MDFELSDEQRLIRETARAFTDGEIVERARENDRNEHFDLELVAPARRHRATWARSSPASTAAPGSTTSPTG